MRVSFSDHVALLSAFLDHRERIVEDIESRLLNVRVKDTSRKFSDETFHSCFFGAPGLPRDGSRLKGQLQAAHFADGFEPVLLDKQSHLELIVRAYHYWDHHRWPGRNARVAYARSLYSVFVLRQLEHLSLRLWDDGSDRAGDRLQEIQRLLDRLNVPNVFVRDARWLVQTAQGPLTRHLRPYFRVAEQIAGSFTDAHRLELHRAGAKLAGGHLRSQLRYRVRETRQPNDHPDVLAMTRNSNSMDAALLVRDLVPLLEAYKTALPGPDLEARLELADAILQGVSADPELFLTRLDLLAPSTMIEDLFVDRGGNGPARYTPMGEVHLGLLQRYNELVAELAGPLKEDAAAFDPSQRVYSPLGVAYGFCGDLLSNMALSTLVSQPAPGLGPGGPGGPPGVSVPPDADQSWQWARLGREPAVARAAGVTL